MLSFDRSAFFLKQLEQRYRFVRSGTRPGGASTSQEFCCVWPLNRQSNVFGKAFVRGQRCLETASRRIDLQIVAQCTVKAENIDVPLDLSRIPADEVNHFLNELVHQG